MVLYTCQKCGYITKLKGDYKKHLNRKNPCYIKENYDDVQSVSEIVVKKSPKKTSKNCSQMRASHFTNEERPKKVMKIMKKIR